MNLLAYDLAVSEFDQDFDDLVHGRRAGHMGHWEFNDNSLEKWAQFLADNRKNYYIPRLEVSLIHKFSDASAKLIQSPVTLVIRGGATNVLPKDAYLAKQFNNVVGVVYIDCAQDVLDRAVADGKIAFGEDGVWHRPILGDMFDPDLRYSVEGTEVNTVFGLTLHNQEGRPHEGVREAYITQMANMRQQMSKGAHLITVQAANQNTSLVEAAYRKQSEFALDMLHQTNSLDREKVDFVVKHFADGFVLAHGYRFKDKTPVTTISGTKVFNQGDVLWFNNSDNPTVDEFLDRNRQAGFKPLLTENRQGPLVWQHLQVV